MLLIPLDNKAAYLDGTIKQANDNRIINVALHLQATNAGAYVCLDVPPIWGNF